MRKLKTLLILMFAACLTFTLFACGGGEENQGYTLNTVRATKQIELTDADTQETFNEKMKTYTLTGTTDEGRVDILGSECDITGTISFHEVDRYTITFKPREHNENGRTAEAVVVIDHDWGPEENGVSVCQYASCGATKDTKQEDVSIHYGGFHYGTGIGLTGTEFNAATAIPQTLLTAEQAATLGLNAEKSTTSVFNADAGISDVGGKDVKSSGRIKDFGMDARANKVVPTLTAGDLAPGMSITIEGYAKTDVVGGTKETAVAPWNATNGNWNAPSYGIADPYSPLCTLADGGIDVGTAVIVRSEGWVLYNGIGQELDNTLGGLPKFISGGKATESGSTDKANCASWEGATADILTGQDVTNRPAYTSSDWKDWWVYSEGQDRHSLDSYQSFTHVRVTWTYRTYKLNPADPKSEEVGIIVIDSDYLDAGTTLRSYIKVPEATRGSYRTIIHGDYSTLLITSSTYIETETVTDMRITGLKADAKTEYIEGEQIDAGAVFNMELKSKQNTEWHTSGIALTNDMLYYYVGQKSADDLYAEEPTEEAKTEIESLDEDKWLPIEDVHGNKPLTQEMKIFKVVLVRGDANCHRLVPKEAAEQIKIVENNVKDAVGDQYTTTLDSRDLMATYTRTSGKDADKKTTVDLTIDRAIFREIPGAQSTFDGLTDATGYRFTTIRIRGIEAFGEITGEQKKTGTVASGAEGADETYYYTYTKDTNGDVLLAIAIKASMRGHELTIKGVQTTDIRFTFGTTSLGFDVSSTSSYTKPTLNNGGEVTIEYKNLATTNTINVMAGESSSFGSMRVSAIANRADSSSGDITQETTLGASGVKVTYYKVDETGDETTTTIKFQFPAFDFANWTTMPYIRVTGAMDRPLTDDYVEYDLSTKIDGNNTNSEDGVYFTEKDGTLYFATAHAATNGAINYESATKSDYVVNINNGDAATAKSFDLSYVHGNAGYSFKDQNLGEAIAIKSLVLSKASGDYGVLVIVSINVGAATGIDISKGYGFQIAGAGENEHHYWKYDTTDRRIVQQTIGQLGTRVVLEQGDCFTKGAAASEAKDAGGNKLGFLANYTVIGGAHVKGSDNTCELCGATIESRTLNDNDSANPVEVASNSFAEITGTYNNVAHAAAYNGIETNIRQGGGSAYRVRVRNDGYFAREQGGDNQVRLLYNSTVGEIDGTYGGTANGQPNGINGEPIDADGAGDYVDAKKEGKFKVTVYFVDDGNTRIATVITSLWTKEQSLDETPYFSYTAQMKIGGKAKSISVNFRIDVNGAAVGAKDVTLVTGKISNSTLGNIVTDEDITVKEQTFKSEKVTASEKKDYVSEYVLGEIPTYAQSIVPEGVAGKLGDAQKTALGVTDADVNYFYSFKTTYTAPSKGNTSAQIIDLATGEVYDKAYVKLDGNNIEVVIPYGGVDTLFLLDFMNDEANTEQGDVIIDLSKLRAADVTMAATGSPTILGGDVTIDTTDDAVPAGAQLWLGNDTLAWSELAADQKLGDLTVKSASATQVVLTVPKADLSKPLEGYTVYLRTADEVLLAQVSFDAIAVPTEGLIDNDVYVIAEGATLILVASANVDSTKPITLNVNGGAATVGTDYDLLNNYDLTVNINEGVASFASTNALTSGATVIRSAFGTHALLAITLDLTAINVSDATPYGFQIALGADKAMGNTIYKVAANRAITTGTLEHTGELATLKESSCTSTGLKAREYSDGISFYYDLEVSPEHNYEIAENGGGAYVCKTCGAVLKADNVKGSTVPAALVAPESGTLVDTGISISFWGNTSSDWGNAVSSGADAVILGLPNIDGWNNTVSTDAQSTDEEKTLAEKVVQTNLTPQGFEQNGATWDVYQNGGECYITIVVSATQGIMYYKDGVLVVNYTKTSTLGNMNGAGNKNPGTVGDFAELFLRVVQRTGVTIGTGMVTAKDVIVEAKTYTETEAEHRYDTYLLENGAYPVHGEADHVDSNSDSHCDYCGTAVEHQHSYNASTHVCNVCGEMAPAGDNCHNYTNGICSCGLICPHKWTSDTCDYCRATKGAGQEKSVAATNYWANGNTFSVLEDALAENGQIIVTATYTNFTESTQPDATAAQWDAAIIGVTTSQGKYALRYLDGAYIGKGGNWNTAFDGETVNTNVEGSTWAHSGDARQQDTLFRMVVSYYNGTVTVVVSKYEKTDTNYATPLATRIMTISGVTGTVNIGIAQGGTSAFESNQATVTTLSWAD